MDQNKKIKVTPAMLQAGYQEVLKVANEKKLKWALKWFPRSFINAILTEGYLKMYEASEEK